MSQAGFVGIATGLTFAAALLAQWWGSQGRASHAHTGENKSKFMEEPMAIDEWQAEEVRSAEAIRAIRAKGAAEAKAEADRVRDIRAMAKAYGKTDREQSWISMNVSVEDVRAEIMQGICEGARAVDAEWVPLLPEPEPVDPQHRRHVSPRTVG